MPTPQTLMTQLGTYIAGKLQDIKDYADGLIAISNADLKAIIKTCIQDATNSSASNGMGTETNGTGQGVVYAAINQAISDLIDGAPAAMDTLKELADAIEDNGDLIAALQTATGNHTHSNATQSTAGFMSAADKTTLDNIGTYSEFTTAFESAAAAS